MKRLLPISLLLAALCISTAAFAQKDKVVEASSKRKPAWIGSSDRSHFAVTEVGETLAAASGKCMASIRQYIVNAVAVNVSSAEKMATRQITRDQLVTAMSDYSSALMTEAGQLPYLNDITLSNAEAVYWERIYSKKTKTYRYEYSVLYPFPEQTRRQLIEAFVAIDDAKQAEYERLRRELGTITDIDRIRLAVNELDGLYDYFFDATRKGDVETPILPAISRNLSRQKPLFAPPDSCRSFFKKTRSIASFCFAKPQVEKWHQTGRTWPSDAKRPTTGKWSSWPSYSVR